MPEGDSFLPRIQSVFYAIFDLQQGPKIVYQVPEGLIPCSSSALSSTANGGDNALYPGTPFVESPPSYPLGATATPVTQAFGGGGGGERETLASRNSSTSFASPTDFYRPGLSRALTAVSPNKRSNSSQRTLFNFDDISMFVIPSPALCGRLVTFSTRRHRIIGFPVELKGKYERNYFRYNLCFVFDREADLSCYEPIVRKISRVLKACEEESGFLTSSQTSPILHTILEQLYEDLNSYSETSIPIDQFNSIELKIFPFYPNPPPLEDWMVPLALINLSKRIEDNWDLTMLKIIKYINGVNHVSRIAYLADCDPSLTRQAISHLLYYQVIMTIDIFQYSNMYTLRKSMQWLADEPHVKEECGPYVTKPDRRNVPDWPRLLHLYSRLKPGKTVYEWMKAYDVEDLGIDVRRFVSFGVIKGFLRRVHRYPVYIPSAAEQADTFQPMLHPAENHSDPIVFNAPFPRKRGHSLSTATALRIFPQAGSSLPDDSPLSHGLIRPQVQQNGKIGFPRLTPDASPYGSVDPHTAQPMISASHRARRASAAEKVLEQIRNREKSSSTNMSSPRSTWKSYHGGGGGGGGSSSAGTSAGGANVSNNSPGSGIPPSASMLSMNQPSPQKAEVAGAGAGAGATNGTTRTDRRHSLIGAVAPPSSPVGTKAVLTPSRNNRISRSPSTPQLQPGYSGQAVPPTIPPMLKGMLNGEHHTDELSVRFEAGWPLLESWLVTLGGEGDGEYGKIAIIYK